MLIYYAFTLDSVLKSVLPNRSEPTWQTSILYSDIFPVIYVNETICMVIWDSSQSFYGPGWPVWGQDYPQIHLMDEGPDAILSFKAFLSFINRLLVTISEKAMAPHSSTLAWKIPWMEEPRRLQSMGLLRVRPNWATSLSLFTFMHWRWKWQLTPLFFPGESEGWGSLVGWHLWGHTESDTTEAT